MHELSTLCEGSIPTILFLSDVVAMSLPLGLKPERLPATRPQNAYTNGARCERIRVALTL